MAYNDGNAAGMGQLAALQQVGLVGTNYVDPNATPRLNLERKIKVAEEHLSRLQDQLKEMEKTGLADIKIETIRQAMNY